MARPTARRVGALLAALAFSPLALAACGSGGDAAAATVDESAPLYASLPADVKEAGVIEVASNVDYAPFESFEDDGKTVVGLDKDLATALESQFGVPLHFNHMAFDAVVPGMAAKRYDVAISGMVDKVERQQSVDMLDYFVSGSAILQLSSSTTRASTLADLCGLRVALPQGGSGIEVAQHQSETCVAEGKPALQVVTFPGQAQQFLAISAGRADVAMTDYATGALAAKKSDGKLEISEPYAPVFLGMAFNKSDTQLRDAFQKGLEALAADGEYRKILDEYGLSSAAVDTFTVNGAKA